jgi:flagellar hook-length control protein FliK
MSPTIQQPIPTAPGGREPVQGGREPISSGAPPGAPPEGPPFQSALETEWARTAVAEGQQQSHSQNPSPADGEQASAAEASDRLPRGSTQPARRHSGHQAASTSLGSKAIAGSASSTTTPAGSNPTLAAALPDTMHADTPAPSATTGGDVNQGPATHLPTQPGPATASIGSLSSGEEGIPNSSAATALGGSSYASAEGALTAAAATHDDALPSSPASPADGALAIPLDGATAGALATPQDGTTTVGGIASALGEAPKDGAIAGAGAGVQAHLAPAAAPTGDLAVPQSSSAPSASTGAGDLAKILSSSAPSTGTNAGGEGSSSASGEGSSSAGGEGGWSHAVADHAADQVHPRSASDTGAHDKLWIPDPGQSSTAATDGVSGLPENAASPLLSAALEGNPAAQPAELGSAAYGVGLQEAIESLHGTIQLTARQGLSQARISLQPEELGEIRINLTQTAQGLLARVTAESPAAAQALAAAHAQLRQSLSSLGINLTRLDVGHHDPSAQGGSTDPKGNGQGGAARGEGFSGSRPGRSTAAADLTDPENDSRVAEETTPSTTARSTGALIDVLV